MILDSLYPKKKRLDMSYKLGRDDERIEMPVVEDSPTSDILNYPTAESSLTFPVRPRIVPNQPEASATVPPPMTAVRPPAVESRPAEPYAIPAPDTSIRNRWGGTPLQVATDKYENIKETPIRNEDRGVKGFLKEFAKNWLSGAGQAARENPQAGLGYVLGAGLGKGGYGAVDRTLNEREALEQRKSNALNEIGIQSKLEDDALSRTAKNVQIGEVLRRPEKEAQAQRDKLAIEAQKQINRINAIVEKRKLAGQDTRIETAKDGSGRLVIRDGNGREIPFNDPDTGEPMYNPLERPMETTTADGRKVTVKGSQILTQDNANAFKEAILKWGEIRANSSISEDNDDEEQRYADKKTSLEAGMGKANSRIKQAETQIVALDGQIAEARKAQNALNGINSRIAAAKAANDTTALVTLLEEKSRLEPAAASLTSLQSQRNQLDREIGDARAEYDGYFNEHQKLKPPKKRPPVVAPKIRNVPPEKDPLGLFR